jgi:hypothetical protein
VLAVLAAAATAASGACFAGNATAPPPRSQPTYAGPQVNSSPHPFGLKWDWGQIEKLTPYISANAGGTTFYEVAWCDVEREPGVMRFGPVDRVVRSAQRLGYRIDLKIRVGSCWATGDENAPENQHRVASAMPQDVTLYAQFVTRFVARYEELGVNDYAFENEVNAKNFWGGTPSEYRHLVKAGADAARAATPGVRIFDAGLSSPAWGVVVADDMLRRGDAAGALSYYQHFYARRLEDSGFLFPDVGSEAALRAAIASEPGQAALAYFAATVGLIRDGIVDAFQLHYYDPWQQLPQLIDVLRARIGATAPIEAWEVGVAWPGDSFDPRVQATDTVKLLITMRDKGVERAVYLPVSFSPGKARKYEVVRPLVDYRDGKPLPAGVAFSQLVASSRGS